MAGSIKRNYVYNLSYQILTLITPFVTTPYISRVLSPDAIGLQSFAFSFSLIFALFADLGIGTYGQRELSYARDDRKKRTQVFWEVQTFLLIATSIWTIIYILAVLFYIKHDYLLFFIVIFLNLNPFGWILGLFYAMEDFGKWTACQFVAKILDVAFIFIFIKKESDLILYVSGSIFFALFSVIVAWFDVHKYVDWPDWKTLRPFRNMKTILLLFLPTIAIQVYSILDKVMLGFISDGTAESGYYELSLRISKMPLMVVASLSTVVIPRIGYLFKIKEDEAIKSYIYRSFKFAWFTSVPLCFGLIALSDNFVGWFFRPNYAKIADLLKVSSFLMIIIGLSNVSGGQYMIPTGRENKYTLTVTTGAVVNFILNLLLIPYFYSYGALAASVLAELSALLTQLYFLRKEFSIREIISSGFSYLFAGLVMFIGLKSFSYKLPSNPLGTSIIIIAGALIYFGVLLILRDEFFIFYSTRTINFIKRKSREIFRF